MRLFALLLCCFLWGCGLQYLFAPDIPPNAERITPPDFYRGWWAEAEVCAEQTRDFDSIVWFIFYDYENTNPLMGRNYDARIYLDASWVIYPNGEFLETPWAEHLVKHESLHALGQIHDRSGQYYDPGFIRCRARHICLDFADDFTCSGEYQ
jgi:hypothetical protein